MSCSTREDWAEALGALCGSVSRLLELTAETLSCPELLTTLGELEVQCRRLPVAGNVLINQLASQAAPADLGGTLGHALADRLRVVKDEADRRIADAADLGPRRALTGEPLAPLLPATAAAQRQGLVGAGHIKVIRRFFKKLPNTIAAADRDFAEADLAGKVAAGCRPDEVADYAKLLQNYLMPDGDGPDEPERARRRGITLGEQQADGMSEIRGLITPNSAPPWNRWSPNSAPRACATPTTNTPSPRARHPRTRSTVTPATTPSAATTPSRPDCGCCWAPKS